jgi:cytoskeletal protein RodZ
MELKPDGKSATNPRSKKQSLTGEDLVPVTTATTGLLDFSEKNATAEVHLEYESEIHVVDEKQDVNHSSSQPDSSDHSMSAFHLTSPQTQTPSNIHKPGEYLRQVRLQKKREIKDIAADLHISERFLIAIEADDYKSLPEPAFIRGYLRAYGRLLGIDSDKLIVQFNEIYTNETGFSSNHSLQNSPLQRLAKLSSRTRKSKRWLIWLFIFVVIVLILTLMSSINSALTVVKDVAINTVSFPYSTSTENKRLANPTSENPSTLAALPPVAVPAQSDQLVFRFSKPTDITVEDANGKMLFTGIAQTTQPLILNGISPFSVRLAEVYGVRLSLNNDSVDLRPFAINGPASFRLSR